MCVYVCVWAHVCHDMPLDVRGLMKVLSFLPPCESWDSIWVIRLSDAPFPLSHLTCCETSLLNKMSLLLIFFFSS